MRTTLLVLLLLGGCGDNFAAVQEADTIEAYESYLRENPDGTYALQAESRLQDLYLDEAREARSLELYDKFLERFTSGALHDKALEEREEMLYEWARNENTGEAWKSYLDQYPKAEKKRKQFAKRMIEVHKYSGQVAITAPVIEQINLAEDPEGPLNGWGFTVEVTNNGSSEIESMFLTIEYLGENGQRLGAREYPVVTPYYRTPLESFRYKPMKPGQTMPWVWTTGDTPNGWARKVRIYPTSIKLVGDG